MSQFSGFVPINFRLVGKLLLIVGIIALILSGISTLTGWFALPSYTLILGSVAIIISLYIILVSREK